MDRRQFLAGAGALVVWQQDTELDADPLRQPLAAGQPRAPVDDLANDETIKSIEKRLKCPCPCNLDVFTCRTTDFTCTFSPEQHAEVLALYRQGLTPDEIIATFVDRYGPRALMAPPASGFNLMGYLVPGAAVLAAGSLLALVLFRRNREQAPAVAAAAARPAAELSAEDRARLERALDEVAD